VVLQLNGQICNTESSKLSWTTNQISPPSITVTKLSTQFSGSWQGFVLVPLLFLMYNCISSWNLLCIKIRPWWILFKLVPIFLLFFFLQLFTYFSSSSTFVFSIMLSENFTSHTHRRFQARAYPGNARVKIRLILVITYKLWGSSCTVPGCMLAPARWRCQQLVPI